MFQQENKVYHNLVIATVRSIVMNILLIIFGFYILALENQFEFAGFKTINQIVVWIYVIGLAFHLIKLTLEPYYCLNICIFLVVVQSILTPCYLILFIISSYHIDYMMYCIIYLIEAFIYLCMLIVEMKSAQVNWNQTLFLKEQENLQQQEMRSDQNMNINQA